jgi:hypothetical protein
MKNIGKFENWIGDPKDLIDEFIKDSNTFNCLSQGVLRASSISLRRE